ncbi:hypothetical protein [Halarcobacter sp.]|uniref:hypothetical protein n=1 Tax=Halarcobacter sp. TaxID=2321133 RepID=UPI003AFF9A33
MEKEQRLFENSDILIIIPESAGSFAELGMIASMINNHSNKKIKETYAKKILILLDKTYKYDDSFLKLGPIKIIKNFGGKHLNINFNSNEFKKLINRLPKKENSKIKLWNFENDSKEVFYINCIKVAIYIYYFKKLSFPEFEYKTSFIESLKFIHNAISTDNIEYLESADLIKKDSLEGNVLISVNHSHSFIEELISQNFTFFSSNKIIYNFLKKSGY